MRLLAVIFSIFLFLPAAYAASVPNYEFRFAVTWDFEDEYYKEYDFETDDILDSGDFVSYARSGFSFSSDAPLYSAFGTSINFFNGSYDFTYDFATGLGRLYGPFVSIGLDEYTFSAVANGNSGSGSYIFDDDDSIFESATLTNVRVTVERLTPVPLPAGGNLLLFGISLLVGRSVLKIRQT
jgi:hypothetical protein